VQLCEESLPYSTRVPSAKEGMGESKREELISLFASIVEEQRELSRFKATKKDYKCTHRQLAQTLLFLH